jgi:hypothetical protein
MFAPKVTKPAKNPNSKIVPQRSPLEARPFGGAVAELDLSSGNQATLRLLAQHTAHLRAEANLRATTSKRLARQV